MMRFVQILFWLLIGLLYLGVHFPYQEPAIGLCALGIGIVTAVEWIKQQRA